jgi:chromosome partitioning protein
MLVILSLKAQAGGEVRSAGLSKIVAIANQKGGVGKTTTTLNLGAALAERGHRVLLVDLDQQGSLTMSVGFEPDELERTIYNVLSSLADPKEKQPTQLESVIQKKSKAGLELVPTNIELAALDLELTRAYNREHILKRALTPLREHYDYILLDCPPSLGLVVINALTAADEVLIPLQADYLAIKGVKLLLESIEAVTTQLNPKLQIAGIVLTLADQRTGHTRQVIKLTRSNFAGKIRVFDTLVKMNVRLKEAPITGQSILEYDGQSEAAQAYRQLAQEVEATHPQEEASHVQQ